MTECEVCTINISFLHTCELEQVKNGDLVLVSDVSIVIVCKMLRILLLAVGSLEFDCVLQSPLSCSYQCCFTQLCASVH